MKSSLGISNFLEEISSLSHSVIFLYVFALIAEGGFLISSCYSLEFCIQMIISFFFSFVFRFSSSWQIDGETVSDFIFLASKITADCDCSHEIKRCLLLGRKVMTNLDSIFESRESKSWLKTQHSENKNHGIQFHHFTANRKQWKQWLTFLREAPKPLQMVTAAMKLKDAYSLERKL